MLRIICTVVLLLFVMRSAESAEIGDAVPSWKGMQGADGRLHNLSDYQDDDFIVVAFLCNKCPCVRGYETRFNRFVNDYAAKGVRFVGINSSIGPLENLNEMTQRAAGGKLNFDYLRDTNQNVGRSFGAKATPHVFILDRNRRVVYSGAFDDNRSEKLVKHHYVIDSINALLAGQSVAVTKTQFFGCAITYE